MSARNEQPKVGLRTITRERVARQQAQHEVRRRVTTRVGIARIMAASRKEDAS